MSRALCRASVVGPLKNPFILKKRCLAEKPLHSLQHSFILAISIAPLQVHYYSEVLTTTARILYRSFTPKCTGNCKQRTCPRSLRGGYSGSRTHDPLVESHWTHDPLVESHRLNQCATTSHVSDELIKLYKTMSRLQFQSTWKNRGS